MRTDRRRVSFGVVFAIVCSLLAFVPSAAAHGSGERVRTVQPPSTTAPPTTPDTTQPETTEPAPSDHSDGADITAATIVSLLAFALLLVLAGWWMVSRNDDDDAPHPRPPGVDEPLPGQDLL